eukprot:gb/GEZN01003071.1/.p1 GENE.gb/GEZN01003071.1/~~gb/GEZN01003071.1/.p1  ORF type:complete len:622 (-),score=67.52 gb/GEZN01003071.1/:339-2204(-)
MLFLGVVSMHSYNFLSLLLFFDASFSAVIGIDLGTSLTAVGYVPEKMDNWPYLLDDYQGGRLTPSMVYMDSTGIVSSCVGKCAKAKGIIQPEAVAYDVKRLLGHRFTDAAILPMQENIPYKLVGCFPETVAPKYAEDEVEEKVKQKSLKTIILEALGFWFNEATNPAAKPKIPVVDRTRETICVSVPGLEQLIPVEVISAAVLSYVYNNAVIKIGEPVTGVVISVPAYFQEEQKLATLNAARIAGLNVLRLVPEPTAAAMAFAFKATDFTRDQKMLVFDFGGGTFDVSLVEREEGKLTVRGIDGDCYLGGSDIDILIASFALDHFCNSNNISSCSLSSLSSRQKVKLLRASEEAKITLSSSMSSPIIVVSFQDNEDLEVILYRSKLTQLMKPIFTKLQLVTLRLLKTYEQFTPDVVLLVGGSSRIPAIHDWIKKTMDIPISKMANADEAVGLGAALLAVMMSRDEYKINSKDSEVSAMVDRFLSVDLTDITPHTYGICVIGEFSDTLVPRGSKLPGSWTKIFTTVYDYQTAILFRVLEGEKKMCFENAELASFDLNGIELAPAGVPQIETTFTVDMNGVLNVKATDLRRGVSHEIVVNSVKVVGMSNNTMLAWREFIQSST